MNGYFKNFNADKHLSNKNLEKTPKLGVSGKDLGQQMITDENHELSCLELGPLRRDLGQNGPQTPNLYSKSRLDMR